MFPRLKEAHYQHSENGRDTFKKFYSFSCYASPTSTYRKTTRAQNDLKWEKWIKVSPLSNTLLPSLQVTRGDPVLTVVVSGVVGGGLGGDVGQVKFESLSIPEEVKLTKPGSVPPVMLLIQSWYSDTRV